MNRNYIFGDVNEALPRLMGDLLSDGDEFGSRAGRTLELMHVGITLNRPWRRELVLPDRKANIAAQVMETMWVLSGRNDVAGLAHYLPRAVDFSDDGKTWRAGYGPRLRDYHGTDQLAYLVDTMSQSPGSRQAVATIWDPTVDTTPGKDIACNNWLSLSSRFGALDLHVGIRSNDAMWGWSGINAFEWSALQEVVAGIAGLLIGSLHFSVTSFHLYDQHWAKAKRLAQAGGVFNHADPPHFSAEACPDLARFDELASEWFYAEELIRYGNPRAGEFVEAFPEPMLQSWLRVLQWYWSGDQSFLEPLQGTRLYRACEVGVKPPGEPQSSVETVTAPSKPAPSSLLSHISALHAEKHAAYGDSWRRRGEAGILSNIARKVDRIGTGRDTSDESQQDTAIDLVVYLAKYLLWLEGMTEATPPQVDALLEETSGVYDPMEFDDMLDAIFAMPAGKSEGKLRLTYSMLNKALGYARSLWP